MHVYGIGMFTMRVYAYANQTITGIPRMVVGPNSRMVTVVRRIVCHTNINAIMIMLICIVIQQRRIFVFVYLIIIGLLLSLNVVSKYLKPIL
jgi:hypothetical protein